MWLQLGQGWPRDRLSVSLCFRKAYTKIQHLDKISKSVDIHRCSHTHTHTHTHTQRDKLTDMQIDRQMDRHTLSEKYHVIK